MIILANPLVTCVNDFLWPEPCIFVVILGQRILDDQFNPGNIRPAILILAEVEGEEFFARGDPIERVSKERDINDPVVI
jgi:hypothetical protein